MKFHKRSPKGKKANKGHVSPMQKKGWAKEVNLDEATALMVAHVEKGVAWSGDEMVYLNALWDATVAVATKLGYASDDDK